MVHLSPDCSPARLRFSTCPHSIQLLLLSWVPLSSPAPPFAPQESPAPSSPSPPWARRGRGAARCHWIDHNGFIENLSSTHLSIASLRAKSRRQDRFKMKLWSRYSLIVSETYRCSSLFSANARSFANDSNVYSRVYNVSLLFIFFFSFFLFFFFPFSRA